MRISSFGEAHLGFGLSTAVCRVPVLRRCSSGNAWSYCRCEFRCDSEREAQILLQIGITQSKIRFRLYPSETRKFDVKWTTLDHDCYQRHTKGARYDRSLKLARDWSKRVSILAFRFLKECCASSGSGCGVGKT